ncbi:MAG: hypothetical protein ACKVP4_06225 [Hyphomicrobium sp.]
MTDKPYPRRLRLTSLAMLQVAALVAVFAQPSRAVGLTESPFQSLAGRWTGEGRLGIKDNPPETVKCRATYIVGDTVNDLKQTIRCATAGGSIEVISDVRNDNGQLAGSWKETTRNIAGDLTGSVTPVGFRVAVRGGEMSANMDIVVRDNRQIIEIQFINSTLQGLTLLMTKS